MTHSNLIGGSWTGSAAFRPNINPADLSDVVGDFASADEAEVEKAIDAAREAHPAWAAASPDTRFDILDRTGTELLARSAELGTLLAREEGKTIAEATGEVIRAGRIFKYFAGETLRLTGDRLASVRQGVDVEVLREPEGIVGLITPWNFPIAIPAWKIAPALAYGNCVVFKPADIVPASAWALTDILVRAGVPPGVFNLVMGAGSRVGQAIVRSPHVRAVSFTGSTHVGRRLAAELVGRGAKVQLEMGGKNPLVVMDDADLAIAVECAINGAFYSTGQRCTASSRLIVQDGIYGRFLAAMRERMGGLKIGNPLLPDTQIGPVASAAQLEQNLEYVRIGTDEGASLAAGGERLRRDTEGHFMAPALLVDTDNSMRVNREEIFGPVASVIRVRDYEEALDIANDSEFGLSSGICTTSLRHATDFKKRSAAGMVMVNLPTAGVDYHVPFGGRKGSSYGPREQGSYAREFYTTVKTAYTCA